MASVAEKRFWLGFDLGGTKMMASVFNQKFKTMGVDRRKTIANKGTKAGVARLVESIEEALKNAGISGRQLAGIGVGAPGTLNLNRGVVLQAANLGWHHVPLQSILEKRFRCPAVVVNDVDAGTYGEYRFGAARRARCVVGVFPGTGIGGSCIYEGRIVRGSEHSCMEIGHMLMVPGGNLCGCGRRGCLETVASRLAIAAECALAALRGHAPHLLETAGTDIREIRSSAIAGAVRAGDGMIEEIVRHAARQLGAAVANTVNLMAPDMVVLGGGLVEEMPKLFVEEVKNSILRIAMRSLSGDVKVAAARLGDNAVVMGAAALAADARESGK